jgi:hypothetical protein
MLTRKGNTHRAADRKQQEHERQQAEATHLKVAHSLIRRLVKYAGQSADARNNYRVTSSGNLLGLLLGTPTFKLCFESGKHKLITDKLNALERGPGVEREYFQTVAFCASRQMQPPSLNDTD